MLNWICERINNRIELIDDQQENKNYNNGLSPVRNIFSVTFRFPKYHLRLRSDSLSSLFVYLWMLMILFFVAFLGSLIKDLNVIKFLGHRNSAKCPVSAHIVCVLSIQQNFSSWRINNIFRFSSPKIRCTRICEVLSSRWLEWFSKIIVVYFEFNKN